MAKLLISSIESFDTPELAPYRTLRQVDEHEQAGIFVATNAKVVQRLLASRFGVISVLLTKEWFAAIESALRSRVEDEIIVYIGDKVLLEKITGYHVHQGALAVGKILAQPNIDTLLASSSRPLLVAAVEGIASAENLGAIVRSCAAFGAHFLIVGETCVSPFQRRSVSGSMGSIFELPIVRSENLLATISRLRAHGVRCLATDLSPDAKKLSAVDLCGDVCFVFGAEGPGLSDAVISACDEIVEIPMPSHMNSLNVAAAAAVFLYEAVRQRE